MPAQNYRVYDPSADEVIIINIYDYPGETIDSFCESKGYEVIACSEDQSFESDPETFFAEHSTAHYADPGYTETTESETEIVADDVVAETNAQSDATAAAEDSGK